MITEPLLNLCNLLILTDNQAVTASVIRDIHDILSSQQLDQVPLICRKKFELASTWCDLKLKNPENDKAKLIDIALMTGHFSDIHSYIIGISEKHLEEERIAKAVDSITQRKQLLQIDLASKEYEKFINKFKSNDYSNPDDALKDWNNLIGNIQNDIIKKQRDRDLHAITELDLSKDNFKPVINQIKVSYSGLDSVSTGYSELDKYMNGGFAPARLYIFGATSGGGKSVMLINFIKNAVENCKKRDGEIPTFVYVTLENLIDETLMRLYCCLTDQTTKDVMKNYEIEKEKIEPFIKNWLLQYGCNVVFIYRKPQMTTSGDIMGFCDQLKAQNKNASIKGIFVDYLDLMKSNKSNAYDAYRLELGDITMDLKVMAVMIRCPVLTVTQLTRGSYNLKEQMTLANIGESMKKVDNADFVAMLQKKDQENEKTGNRSNDRDNEDVDLILNIKKNRSGPSDRSIAFVGTFAKFLIKQANSSECLDIDAVSLGVDASEIDDSVSRMRARFERSAEFAFM